jgi:hypothetical protein
MPNDPASDEPYFRKYIRARRRGTLAEILQTADRKQMYLGIYRFIERGAFIFPRDKKLLLTWRFKGAIDFRIDGTGPAALGPPPAPAPTEPPPLLAESPNQKLRSVFDRNEGRFKTM